MKQGTRRKRIDFDKWVRDLTVQDQRYAEPDPELIGHYVRVTPGGTKSFVAVARDPYGKQVWTTIGATDHLTIEEAREKARDIIKRVKVGKPAIEPTKPKPESYKAVAEEWLKREVAKKKLRSEREIRRCLDRYVYPTWASLNFVDIKRSDITRLLDHIEDNHGAVQADRVLAYVRRIANWFASREDDYLSPFTRGMGRADPKDRERKRILSDDELRAIWKVAETSGTFGAFVRLALLTAQRREKLMSMRWSAVVDCVWNISIEKREKGAGGALVLPAMANAIISAQPRIAGNPFVLAGRGNGYFNGLSKAKRHFDDELPQIPHWTPHDLRRTARSLMSRAGVNSDHAERVLGHVIKGVEGVYDRHTYRDEKAEALRRLAALIQTIISPPAGNVIQLTVAGKG